MKFFKKLFSKKPVNIVNLKWFKFVYEIDTFGSNKNYDKLLTNCLRIFSILGLFVCFKYGFSIFELFIFILSIIFIGVTDIIFFRNNCKELIIKVW